MVLNKNRSRISKQRLKNLQIYESQKPKNYDERITLVAKGIIMNESDGEAFEIEEYELNNDIVSERMVEEGN